MKRWLVVGLGNPGKKYRETRHNAGFWVLDALARQSGISLRRRVRFSAWLGEGTWRGEQVIMVKPASFMNASGSVVRKVTDFFKIPLSRVLVVVDDVNLPPGRIRIRARGGSGGHHGLESIIREMGGGDFPRLRLGIGGGALEELTGHVLSPIGSGEKKVYDHILRIAIAAIGEIVETGIEAAMSAYNWNRWNNGNGIHGCFAKNPKEANN